MEDSDLSYSYHAGFRMKQRRIPTTDVQHAVQTGNKVNYGFDNSTNVHYDANCKVVESNNRVITVVPNKRNTRFDILRNNKTSVEKLKYQAEVRNNDHAMCDLAELYLSGEFGEKDVKKAYELFLCASERGNSHAMCKISQLFESGELGKPDKEMAQEWMMKAADHGNTYALAVTGQRLLSENSQYKLERKVSDSSDKTKILYYLEKAASKGSSRALWTLGNIYERGLLGTKDINKAIELYSNAAKTGSPASVESLTSFCKKCLFSCEKLENILNGLVGYLAKSSIGMLRQIGISQIIGEVGFSRSRGLNMVEASVLNLKTHEDAIQNLIECYKKGIACDADLRLCQYWYNELYSLYKTSSEQGNVSSLWKMGKFHLHGHVGHIDLDEAESCFKKAVSLSNNLKYKIYLGDMYCEGVLGDRDVKMGEELIKEALEIKEQKALQNNFDECYSLGLIYSDSDYTFASDEKAHYWFHKAAAAGVEDAEFSLAELYLDKKSGYTDIQEGLKIIKKLISSGSSSTCLKGFSCLSDSLTFEDDEYISWLKENSELKLSQAQGGETILNKEYILKRRSLTILAEGYRTGELGGKKDIQMASQCWYKLFDEFKIHQYMISLIETCHRGELPNELHSIVKEWVIKVPTWLEESTDYKIFFELCLIQKKVFYYGIGVSIDLLESAKYKCIRNLHRLPQEKITSENLLDLLPEDYSSVIDELKSVGITVIICRLAEKFKTTSLILYKILSRMLGDVFYGGYIDEKDIDKAIYWYSEASLLNNARASFTLAQIYRSTSKKNLYKSLKYYKLAVKQGRESAVKELISFIEENPMFKTHLPFLDNYTHKSSIPRHFILQTPPFKNLTKYPSNSTEMHELAMTYLSDVHTSKENLNNAVYWLRKNSSNLNSKVELFLIYSSGMLGENVKPVADKIKIDIIEFCKTKFSNVKTQSEESEPDVKAGLKSLASTLESLKKLSDDSLFHDIIIKLEKCVGCEEISIIILNEVIAICNEVIDKSECHMLVKEGYSPNLIVNI